MKVDRIVADLFIFINRLLWWRSGEIEERPFAPIGKPMRGDLGIAQRIHPRSVDIGRCVDYWVFSPFPHLLSKGQTWKDLHISCSYLLETKEFAVDKRTTGRTAKAPKIPEFTHQIDVIEADHRIDRKNGNWTAEQVHTEKLNLIGIKPVELQPKTASVLLDKMPWINVRRDGFAVLITASIAMQLLTRYPSQIPSWSNEIDLSARSIMGAAYPKKSQPRLKKVRSVNNRIVLDLANDQIESDVDWQG